MKQSKFYLQGTQYEKESFNQPQLIQFEWNIIYGCNYRCKYCFFEGKWKEYGKRNVSLSIKDWMKHWRRIYRIYGNCSLLITGGEPFIYPDFIDLIKELSLIHHPINISTNSSGDLAGFIEVINPHNISVTLSFHPEYDSLKTVLGRKKILKDSGFDSEFINFVAYPLYFNRLDSYIEQTINAGERLKVIPFIGFYNGRRYPDSYTKEERKILGLGKKWQDNVERKGLLCAAGMKSALIFPDGKVARCGQIGERFLIGNIFSENFALLNEPLICDVESCPCLETPEN